MTDYIAQRLAEDGVNTVFGMSGGAAVHLFDSFSSHPEISVVATTHEQAAAMAADGYARVTGRLGVAVSTSGPGATNLLTGVCCSFYDSIPTLMITGQVARHRLKGDLGVRQLGFQETDVLSIFKSVTKFVGQAKSADEVPKLLDMALAIAFDGRPGPVLIDLPDDIQRQMISRASRRTSRPRKRNQNSSFDHLDHEINLMLEKLSSAIRPILIVGGGVKTPDCREKVRGIIDQLQIPVVLTWGAIDVLPSSHDLNQGPFGVYGPRSGNLAVQDSDFLLCIGTRLSQNLTGGVLESFARDAFKCVVDVDFAELSKFAPRGMNIDLPVCSTAADFVEHLEHRLSSFQEVSYSESIQKWNEKLSGWKRRFRSENSMKTLVETEFLDANAFVRILSGHLKEETEIFVDTGGNLTWTCNTLDIKDGQRIHSAWNFTPMGYSVPAALGGSFANHRSDTVVIIGDGGMLLCLGELATIARYEKPLKIFVFNNGGHGIQKQTLETWLGANYVAVDNQSGLGLIESWSSVAQSVGIDFERIDSFEEIDVQLERIMTSRRPVLIEVMISPEMRLYPYLKYGNPLEEQYPEALVSEYINELHVSRYVKSKNNLTSKQGQEGW